MESTDHEIHEIHEVYKDEEVIDVQMRVKDYRLLMTMIERERSMGVVWKYAIAIAGGFLTFWAVLKTGVLGKFVG